MENLFETIAAVNDKINSIVWGIPMLVLIISTGIYMTVRTNFFQVTKAKYVNEETFLAIFTKKSVTKTEDKKSISQFQALSTALAATIGTGNIAGVASAITIGGPGAVFWMWVSAFFGMMTNYSENVLGIFYRKKNIHNEWSGGAMYYIEHGLKDKAGIKHIAKPLAMTFALFCVLASFGIGNVTQVNSIAGALQSSFGIKPIVTGIVIAVIASLGNIAGQFVSLAILLFAFSTVLGWSFYGTKATEYLLGTKYTIVYKVLFITFIVVGSTMSLDLAWNISDTLNGLMAIPNLIGVLLLSGTVVNITKDYVNRNIKNEKSNKNPLLSAYPEINQEHSKYVLKK